MKVAPDGILLGKETETLDRFDLAWVEKIVAALGGSTTAKIQNTAIFTVQLTLPVSPPKKISKAGPA